MKLKEIRGMSDDVLAKKEKDLVEELFKLRFQNSIRRLENTSRLCQLRKDITRMKTIRTERSGSQAHE